jgi:hypothetical protein
MPLFGISFDFDPIRTPCLVSPYFQHGNIRRYLQKHPDVDKLPLVSHVAMLIKSNTFVIISSACTNRLGTIVPTFAVRCPRGCERGEHLG